jgi:hypothetical protein
MSQRSAARRGMRRCSGMGGRTCFALPRGPFRMSLMPGKARFTNFPKNVGVKRMSPADAVDVGAVPR